jgi:hypothetical protein
VLLSAGRRCYVPAFGGGGGVAVPLLLSVVDPSPLWWICVLGPGSHAGMCVSAGCVDGGLRWLLLRCDLETEVVLLYGFPPLFVLVGPRGSVSYSKDAVACSDFRWLVREHWWGCWARMPHPTWAFRGGRRWLG